jgi:hypothetical protein
LRYLESEGDPLTDSESNPFTDGSDLSESDSEGLPINTCTVTPKDTVETPTASHSVVKDCVDVKDVLDTISKDPIPVCINSPENPDQASPDFPRTLTTRESQESLDSWRSEILTWLSIDPQFVPFVSNCTWTRKGKRHPNRGLCDDPPPGRPAAIKVLALNAMLCHISRHCPVITPRSICDYSTSLDNVWHLVYTHFNCTP